MKTSNYMYFFDKVPKVLTLCDKVRQNMGAETIDHYESDVKDHNSPAGPLCSVLGQSQSCDFVQQILSDQDSLCPHTPRDSCAYIMRYIIRNGKTLATSARALPFVHQTLSLAVSARGGSPSLFARVGGRTLIFFELSVLLAEPLDPELIIEGDHFAAPFFFALAGCLPDRPSRTGYESQEAGDECDRQPYPSSPAGDGSPEVTNVRGDIADHQSSQGHKGPYYCSHKNVIRFFSALAVVQVVEKINDAHVKGLSWWSRWIEETFVEITDVTLYLYYSIRSIYMSMHRRGTRYGSWYKTNHSTKSSILNSTLCMCTESLGYGALRRLVPEEIVRQKYKPATGRGLSAAIPQVAVFIDNIIPREQDEPAPCFGIFVAQSTYDFFKKCQVEKGFYYA